jgi:predicted amidohydrolase YtcJ
MIDQLLTNGVLLGPEGILNGDAIALMGDRILAVGKAEDLRPLAGKATKIHDMQGASVIPGLVDAHIHWQWTALNLERVNLMDLCAKALCLEKVAAGCIKTPPGKWVTGFGWAQGTWTDTAGAFPTAADLDHIAPDHPVYLSARSGHAAWCNSAALKLAGIGPSTPDPDGGTIQRDASGAATGILFENAMGLVWSVIPKPQVEDIARLMEKAQWLAWEVGLTGLHDYDGPDCLDAMQLLRERGHLGLRMVKNINDPHIHHAHALGLRWGFGDDWLRIGGLKIFADGAIGSLTARMLEPYEGDPSNLGITCTTPEATLALVLEATRRGLPSTIHAIGDRAVREILDVFEAARKEEARLGIPRSARRHRIEHVQIIHPDDVLRLGQLDIIASMQPIHATSDYPMADRHWGSRCALAYNPKAQLMAGARLAFGSDAPVESFDPLAGIHAAVTRQRADGSPGPDGWYPEARISVGEALRGYTEGPAWAAGMEDRLGRIAPGHLADLVALNANLYDVPPEDLHLVKVMGTMVGGRWRSGQWAPWDI